MCHQQRNEIMKHLVFVVKAFLQQLENFFSHPLQKFLQTHYKTTSLLSSVARYYEPLRNKKQELFSLSTSSWSAFRFLIDHRLSNRQKQKTTHNCSPHLLRFPHPNIPKYIHNALIYLKNLPLMRYPSWGVLRCLLSRKDRNYSKPFDPWQA